MARTAKSIDLEAITRAGQRAVSGWLDPRDLPAKYRNPQVYKIVLEGLARDLPSHVANGRDFQAAFRAVSAWSAGQQLLETASRLYHDPRVRSIVNNDEATMQYYWNNPEKLMPILAKHSVEIPKSYHNNGPVTEVMAALSEYQTFDETYGSGSGPVESAEQTTQSVSPGATGSGVAPPDRSRLSAKPAPGLRKANGKEPVTYAELIAAEKLTPAQWARLQSLAANKYPTEDPLPGPKAEPMGQRQTAAKPSREPTSYRELIRAPNLSQEQWARLSELAEQRHPASEEDDPNALLPDSYFWRRGGHNQ